MIFKNNKIDMQIILWIIIFIEILSYIIIADIILSWLVLLWINFRPKFIANILDPIYQIIKKIIPTTFWPIDLTAIIVIFILFFMKWLLFLIFPEYINQVIN